ncbi:YqeB family protein [Micromonospora sp. DT31]|uniref:YqeB family protein n=1 Tax=Micromonospora sp. DT31 TaxID=3393434 RepID=UPI003CF8D010
MPDEIVVDGGRGELVLMWAGFPLVGGGLGAAVTALSSWIAGLPWFPFQGVFELLDRWPDELSYAIGAGAGVLGGLLLAVVAVRDRLTVTVGHRSVRLHRDGHGRDVARTDVAGVFVDGKALVLLNTAGGELARETSDLDGERLGAAFTRQGWPWLAQDPHRDTYRRWVEGLPDLPPGADALLRARQRALDGGHDGEVRELHGELVRLGVVVRDEGKRQYWRLVAGPPSR